MEANLTTCKKCQLIKVKVLSGMFNTIQKRFVDENGGLWNGSTCASCNRERVRNKMQELRVKRKFNGSQGTDPTV